MKRLFSCLFFSFMLLSCTPKYGIQKPQSFVRESVAGTVQTNNNGRPIESGVSKTHLIYVETVKGAMAPEWNIAWVDGKPYTIRAAEVQPGTVIGTTKDHKDMQVHAKSENQLWQLVLFPPPSGFADSTLKNNSAPIVLTGKWNGKDFRYAINKEQELEMQMGQ